MSLTPSTMLPIGTVAPSFRLPDYRRAKPSRSMTSETRQRLLVIFLCNHCPYVKHVRHELAGCARNTKARASPSSASAPTTSSTHPDDSPAMMAREKADVGYHVSVSVRRVAGGRPGVSGGLHA